MNEDLVYSSALVRNCIEIAAEDTIYTIIKCHLTDYPGVMVIFQDAYSQSGLEYISYDKLKEHGLFGKYHDDIKEFVK